MDQEPPRLPGGFIGVWLGAVWWPGYSLADRRRYQFVLLGAAGIGLCVLGDVATLVFIQGAAILLFVVHSLNSASGI
jgi:hypothetical protein